MKSLKPITIMTTPNEHGVWEACLLCSLGDDCYEFKGAAECPVAATEEAWRQYEVSKDNPDNRRRYGRWIVA